MKEKEINFDFLNELDDDLDLDLDSDSELVPIFSEEDINEWTNSAVNLSKIFASKERYEELKNELKAKINSDFSLRNQEANITVEDNFHLMSVGKLFVNLLLLKPFIEYGVCPKEEDLFMDNSVTQKGLERFFNHVIDRFREEDIQASFDEIRKLIYETMNEMCDLSGEYNVRVGNSISYRDLIRLQIDDPKADELMHPNVKSGQFSDIEAQFNNLGKQLVEYFESREDAELHPFVSSETGINNKQLTQCISFIGLKPSMSGEVIPVNIKDNFLGGLKSLESYYINSSGTKKALKLRVPLNLFKCGKFLRA